MFMLSLLLNTLHAYYCCVWDYIVLQFTTIYQTQTLKVMDSVFEAKDLTLFVKLKTTVTDKLKYHFDMFQHRLVSRKPVMHY